MSWDLRFTVPIILPNGKRLATLRDAAGYITKLSESEHAAKEWQTAMHCLIQAADHGGPVDFARIGVMQALHRHEEKVYDTSRKDPKWRNNYKLVRNR
jgi:hypothetical protein